MKLLKIFLTTLGVAAAVFQVRGAGPAPSDASPLQQADALELRYAEAQVRLAEANLKKVQQTNQRVAQAVAPSVVAEYQQDVEVARLRLQQAPQAADDLQFQVCLRSAAASWKAADSAWRNSLAANKHVPGTVDDLDVDRCRWRAEVARANYDRGQALAQQPGERRVQWQISLLMDDVQRLKDQILRGTPNSRATLFWDY